MAKAKCYKKRSGTSGISGHLYETKLIAFILFRLQHDERVENFCLVSNMDDIGAFDDVCFKIKLRGRAQPIAVFIQAKHKENNEKYPTFDNKNESVKWFESLTKIKKKITSKYQDEMFSGDIVESDCVFVLYTNAKCDFDSDDPYVSDYDGILNGLIATSGTVGTLPLYTEQHIEAFGLIILNEDITLLAEHLAGFLSANHSMNIMNDEYIQQYHIILKEKVVDVSDVQSEEHNSGEKSRTLTFPQKFFKSQDQYVMLFKDRLFREILMNNPKLRKASVIRDKSSQKTSEAPVNVLVSTFLSDPSVDTLTPLVITHIACNENGQLEFLLKRPPKEVEQLRQINIKRAAVDDAFMAARTVVVDFLKSLKLKVPIAFGNVDLAISGNAKKMEKRLLYLTSAVVNMCKNGVESGMFKVVTIDDTIDSGVLGWNGGLASAVGNLLVQDHDTNILMFAKHFTSEQNNAKALLQKLINTEQLGDLHQFRFHINTIKFPKLDFDGTSLARGFLNKLVIFAKQKNQLEVEVFLKECIEYRLKENSHTMPITSDLVFLHYHNQIQTWWMSPKSGTYLTKADNLEEQAITNIVKEPHISALQIAFYVRYIKCFGYRFCDDATDWIQVPEVLTNIFVVTDTVTLSSVKVIQCLKSQGLLTKHAVVDVERVFDMPAVDFSSLCDELRKTGRVIILVWQNTRHNNIPLFRLYELSQAMKDKQAIVFTNAACMKMLKECFPSAELLIDETQTLKVLTLESLTEVTRDAKVLFQGQEVSLDLVVDDVSAAFVKGVVLDRVTSDERLSVGAPLSTTSYEEISHLYINRRVSECGQAPRVIGTLYDVPDDVVLLTATPGMGKSTLLTHLSTKTKELHQHVWIVRINLLNHSRQFYSWQSSRTAVGVSEAMQFICQAVSRINNVQPLSISFVNNEAQLDNSEMDSSVHFELNLFLHFYNQRRLVFLFDGFDEICPHYKDTAINFLKVVRDFPRSNKMWVTSRPCSAIGALHELFGNCYKLEHLSLGEQETYLETIWRDKVVLDELDKRQRNNLGYFMKGVSQAMAVGIYYNDALNTWIRKIFAHFFEYVRGTKNYEFQMYIYRKNSSVPETRSFELSYDSLPIPAEVEAVMPEVETMSGTPLFLYFVADYTANIVDNDDLPKYFLSNGHVYNNVVSIYETFVKNKLKKVLFEDKNKMDVYSSDNIMRYERELAECISLHKRVAAHVVLHLRPTFNEVDEEEFRDMSPFKDAAEFDAIVSRIKGDSEKVGLISHVTIDGVPVYIHKTFLEYFAAEYICDVLRSDKFAFDMKQRWLNAASDCCDEDVFIWVRYRAKLDEQLAVIVRQIGTSSPALQAAIPSTPVYVSRLHYTTKADDIGQYVRKKANFTPRVQLLEASRNVSFLSFVVRVPNTRLSLVMEETFWPQGVVFRRFRGMLPLVRKKTEVR